MPLVSDLLECLRGSDTCPNCGLKPLPHVVRFRVLDPALRLCVGNLGDITAPLGHIAALPMSVSRVYIVENMQTGLSFEDLRGAVVFMGLGRAACALVQVPWVASAECIYWGDIDTHGLAILSSLRAVLPTIVSVLMDEPTLLRFRDLWVDSAECIYWGDIDTHGLAILSSLRAVLPTIVSVLMDEPTLLRFRDLW